MDYFDCHADTLTEIPGTESLLENSRSLDLKRVREFGGRYTQIFAIWTDILKETDKNHNLFPRLYQRAVSQLLRQEEHIVWCRSAADMQKAHGEGKAAAFLSVEDISIMGGLVEQIRALGIRFAMLTWNYENPYASGAAAGQEKGLTKKGRRLLRELQKQQIIIDISHLSDRGTDDVFALTDAPVMASHSNVREVFCHPRNLNKAQIRELIRRKGLLGINFYGPFAGESQKMTDLLRHMDAVLCMGGADILAIGSDFDGCGGKYVSGIAGVQSVPYLKTVMTQAGFGSGIIEKIFAGNAERFLNENL